MRREKKWKLFEEFATFVGYVTIFVFLAWLVYWIPTLFE